MNAQAQEEKDPAALMRQVAALRSEASEIELAAVTQALGLTAGNITQAAIILDVSPGYIRNAFRDGRRLSKLQSLATRKRGRPPIVMETIEREANKLPKAIAQTMPITPRKKKLPALPPLRSPEERKAIAEAWIDRPAESTETQKQYAKRHKVGVSTLREWCTAVLKARGAQS